MDNPKAKILVVDDEPNVLLTVSAILEYEGYSVDSFGDPEKALDAIRTRSYDLVLTDLKMPKVDGLAILAEVRRSSPNTVTVMMTGFASVDSALEAVQLGAYEYLLKPTEVADLKLAVKRSLERKRLSEIDTLYKIARTLTTAENVAQVSAEVSDAVRRVLNVTFACVAPFLGDSAGNECDPSLAALLRDPEVLGRLTAESTIAAGDAVPAAREWAEANRIHDYAIVPGLSGGRLVCAVCAHNLSQPYEFHASARRFLTALAGQTALALNNAALIAELRRNNQELAAANDKLRELDRLKSQFLSVATHELRTPLTVILGYNSMLAESMEDRLNDEEQETLRESVNACKRLIRLVNSMLDISQIESGRMRMNFAPTDARQLVNATVALFQHEARARKIHFGVQVPARLPRVSIDAERIQQVLINLIGNALKFTPEGGAITLSVRQRTEPPQIEIAVSDTGIGIAPEDQARIFEEFSRVRRDALHGAQRGAGLGLAISRRIVQAHDGAMQVSSKPGKGSTFTFTLPVRERASLGTAVSA